MFAELTASLANLSKRRWNPECIHQRIWFGRHDRWDIAVWLHVTAIACVASLIVYIPIYLAFFGSRVLAAPWHELVWQSLYWGVLTGVVSLVLFGCSVALLGASAAGAFVALGAVIATLLADPILNEWPTGEEWIGISVISVGVHLASGARCRVGYRPGLLSPILVDFNRDDIDPDQELAMAWACSTVIAPKRPIAGLRR